MTQSFINLYILSLLRLSGLLLLCLFIPIAGGGQHTADYSLSSEDSAVNQYIGTELTKCEKQIKLKLLKPHKKFVKTIMSKSNSFYSIAKPNNLPVKNSLAIGIFDSGIGGLTVFDAIINADHFNADHESQPDGVKDFNREQFIYFADQANMPYSNYVEAGKKELLVEHVLKDFLFLYNNKYHPSPDSPITAKDKPGVKAIVIACNTATAYGKLQVEELCRVAELDVKVIGVIDAGCKGALEHIRKDENVAIGIMATPATVSSMAYVNTLNEFTKEFTGNIIIVQQGGKGLHESIDNKPEFININYTKPYAGYMGPALYDTHYRIEKDLLRYYNFDTTTYQILYNKGSLELSDTVAINSVENYTRYHVVSLMEKLKKEDHPVKLKSIILGCTHYPYVSNVITRILKELKKTERYSYLLSDSIFIVDPAVNTAKELYEYLSENELFNEPEKARADESYFYISVPNPFEPTVEIENDGRFTLDYQYTKRNINELKDFTLIVPFSYKLISDEQINLIRERLPATYNIINKKMGVEN